MVSSAAETATVLSASLNPATAGARVTLTAKVTSGSGTPGGDVQFYYGGTLLGTATLSGGSAAL